MKQFINYWKVPVFPAAFFTTATNGRTYVWVVSALLASLAAVLQAAGGLIPGIGFFISPFATLPVVVSTCVSIMGGFFTYVLAIGLLFMLQPAELFIFPFTTGLLGLVIGFSFKILKRRLPVVLLSGASLFAGICFVALVLQFPIFGPASVSTQVLLIVLLFSMVYSYIWVEISRFFVRRLFMVLRL